MVMPTRSQIQPVLLQILQEQGAIAAQEAVEQVTLRFQGQLTAADLTATLKDGRTLRWVNRVHWARMDLVHSGKIDGSERGIWKLTEAGAVSHRPTANRPSPSAEQEVTSADELAESPNRAVQTMLLVLLQEVTNADLPWTMEQLDDGSVTLSYEGRLRVILRP